MILCVLRFIQQLCRPTNGALSPDLMVFKCSFTIIILWYVIKLTAQRDCKINRFLVYIGYEQSNFDREIPVFSHSFHVDQVHC